MQSLIVIHALIDITVMLVKQCCFCFQGKEYLKRGGFVVLFKLRGEQLEE